MHTNANTQLNKAFKSHLSKQALSLKKSYTGSYKSGLQSTQKRHKSKTRKSTRQNKQQIGWHNTRSKHKQTKNLQNDIHHKQNAKVLEKRSVAKYRRLYKLLERVRACVCMCFK